jgi:hypothetical protein
MIQLTQLLVRNGQNIKSISTGAYYGCSAAWASQLSQKKHYMSAAVFLVVLQILHRW